MNVFLTIIICKVGITLKKHTQKMQETYVYYSNQLLYSKSKAYLCPLVKYLCVFVKYLTYRSNFDTW